MLKHISIGCALVGAAIGIYLDSNTWRGGMIGAFAGASAPFILWFVVMGFASMFGGVRGN